MLPRPAEGSPEHAWCDFARDLRAVTSRTQQLRMANGYTAGNNFCANVSGLPPDMEFLGKIKHAPNGEDDLGDLVVRVFLKDRLQRLVRTITLAEILEKYGPVLDSTLGWNITIAMAKAVLVYYPSVGLPGTYWDCTNVHCRVNIDGDIDINHPMLTGAVPQPSEPDPVAYGWVDNKIVKLLRAVLEEVV